MSVGEYEQAATLYIHVRMVRFVLGAGCVLILVFVELHYIVKALGQ